MSSKLQFEHVPSYQIFTYYCLGCGKHTATQIEPTYKDRNSAYYYCKPCMEQRTIRKEQQ